MGLIVTADQFDAFLADEETQWDHNSRGLDDLPTEDIDLTELGLYRMEGCTAVCTLERDFLWWAEQNGIGEAPDDIVRRVGWPKDEYLDRCIEFIGTQASATAFMLYMAHEERKKVAKSLTEGVEGVIITQLLLE